MVRAHPLRRPLSGLAEVVRDFGSGAHDRDVSGNKDSPGGRPVRDLVLLDHQLTDVGRAEAKGLHGRQATTASTAVLPKMASATMAAAPVTPARSPRTVGATRRWAVASGWLRCNKLCRPPRMNRS